MFANNKYKEKQTSKKFLRIIIIPLCIVAILLFVFLFIHTLLFQTNENFVGTVNLNLNNLTLTELNSDKDKKEHENNNFRLDYFEDNQYKSINKNNVEIKGHGNSTWEYFPKKSYQIKFKSKENLCNLGTSKKWLLIANSVDDSNLQNDTAFFIAKMLNIKNTWNGKFVNLFINGKYIGIYWLTHKVEINEEIDVVNKDGIIAEIDDRETDKMIANSNIEKKPITIKDSNYDDQTALAIFMKSYNLFEKAVYDKNWNDIQKYCDVESFAKYIILSEISKNADAYVYGIHYYINKEDDIIHSGPIWDYDHAFGSFFVNNYANDTNTNFCYTYCNTQIFCLLMDIPEFFDLVRSNYLNTIYHNKQQIIEHINNTSHNILPQSCLDIFKRLTINHKNQTVDLISWLNSRLDYIDKVLFGINHIDPGKYNIKLQNGEIIDEFNIETNSKYSYTIHELDKDENINKEIFEFNEHLQNSITYANIKLQPSNSQWAIIKDCDSYFIVWKCNGMVLEYNNGWHLSRFNNRSSQKFLIEICKN